MSPEKGTAFPMSQLVYRFAFARAKRHRHRHSHMDTVAHATLTRKTLRAALERRGLAKRVLMPDDGEEYVGRC